MFKRRHIGMCVLLFQTTYSHQKENVLWKDLFSLKEISFIGGENIVFGSPQHLIAVMVVTAAIYFFALLVNGSIQQR